MIPSNFPNMENQSRYGQLSKNGKMIVELFDLWKDKGLPIKSQSDKCIKFVYTILPNN